MLLYQHTDTSFISREILTLRLNKVSMKPVSLGRKFKVDTSRNMFYKSR